MRHAARNLHEWCPFSYSSNALYGRLRLSRGHNRRACGKFCARRIMLSIEEVRRAASHFPSSKRGCRKLMIDDPSAAAAAAVGAIRLPQKMRNFLRPYTPKRFAATYNQRLGVRRFMDCRVIRGNDAIRAHRRAAPVRIFRNLCVHGRR